MGADQTRLSRRNLLGGAAVATVGLPGICELVPQAGLHPAVDRGGAGHVTDHARMAAAQMPSGGIAMHDAFGGRRVDHATNGFNPTALVRDAGGAASAAAVVGRPSRAAADSEHRDDARGYGRRGRAGERGPGRQAPAPPARARHATLARLAVREPRRDPLVHLGGEPGPAAGLSSSCSSSRRCQARHRRPFAASRSLGAGVCRRSTPTPPITRAISAFESPPENFRATRSRSCGSSSASAARTVSRCAARSACSSAVSAAASSGSASSAARRLRRRSSSSAALRAIPNSQASAEPRSSLEACAACGRRARRPARSPPRRRTGRAAGWRRRRRRAGTCGGRGPRKCRPGRSRGAPVSASKAASLMPVLRRERAIHHTAARTVTRDPRPSTSGSSCRGTWPSRPRTPRA